MKNSRLITLLKTFSKKEMKEFKKFIVSPYFNKGRNYLPLYKVLKGFHPEFSSPNLTEENIFKKLYPYEKFNKKKTSTLRSMISRMNEMAEKFMVYDGFETGKLSYDFNKCLSKAYINNNLFDSALKITLKNSKMINKDLKKEMYVDRRLETNSLLSDIFVKVIKPKEEFNLTANNILYIYAHIFDVLARFHNKYRVQLRNINLNYKGDELVMHFIKTFDLKLFDKVCSEDDYETKKLTMINYYYLKSFIDESDNESIMNAIDIYIKVFDKLNIFSQHRYYTLLSNRCIGKSRFNSMYLSKGNELTDFVWSKGIFIYDRKRYVDPIQYLSVLHSKMSLLDSIGLLKFVSEYADRVTPEYSEDLKNYSYACIYFKEKSFEESLKLVSRNYSVNFSLMKTNIQKLKVRCMYELLYFENVLSELDTFEHFLRKNNNVSEIVKSENLNFIYGIKELIKVKLGEMKEPDFEMKEVMELTQNSVWGWWFKEKIEELQMKQKY